MDLPTPRKEAAVEELSELMSSATAVILTDYRGLSVSQISDLRRQLRDQNSEYQVTKNTLTVLAAQKAGITGMDELLAGPTALAFSFSDPSQTAKVLNDFARTSRILSIKAGLLNKRMISAAEVGDLANLEPRDVLLAKLLGGLNSPIAGLVGVLNASISSIAYVLQARIDQLGGAPAEPAAE